MKIASDYPVALLLATYNGEAYLREFLDSLCAQTFKDFCIYARDDGSTDMTLEIFADYGQRLNIQVLPSAERLGPARGFMHIMQEASAHHQYYLLADQDDYWYPDKIERAVRALRDHVDEVMLYCTRLEYVDEKLQHLGLSRLPHLLTLENAAVENIATGCSVAITQRLRREVLQPAPQGFIMHDWWLYLFASAFGRVIYDPVPSIKYRQHGANTLGAATGWVDDFRRRWRRFTNRSVSVHQLSGQVRGFLNCYSARLAPGDRRLLELLVAGTERLGARLHLAILPPVSRQSRLDTMIMRVLFLMGRY